MAEQKRVEVGFSGGQAIALRLSDDSYERLRRSLSDGGRWWRSRRSTARSRSTSRRSCSCASKSPSTASGFSGL